MTENTNNFKEEEMKFEKLSDDELQVTTGGKWSKHGSHRGPVPTLYKFCKGEEVIYIDEKGKDHRAQITLIEWHDWTPICNIVLLDKPRTLKVHPSRLRKGPRF